MKCPLRAGSTCCPGHYKDEASPPETAVMPHRPMWDSQQQRSLTWEKGKPGERQLRRRLGHNRADPGATRERTDPKFSKALRWPFPLCLHKASTHDISLQCGHTWTSAASLVQIWERKSVARTTQLEPKNNYKSTILIACKTKPS